MRLLIFFLAFFAPASVAIQCYTAIGAGSNYLPPTNQPLTNCPFGNYCYSQYINQTMMPQTRSFGCDVNGVVCPNGLGCNLAVQNNSGFQFISVMYTYTCCCGADGCNSDFNSFGPSNFEPRTMTIGVVMVSLLASLV